MQSTWFEIRWVFFEKLLDCELLKREGDWRVSFCSEARFLNQQWISFHSTFLVKTRQYASKVTWTTSQNAQCIHFSSERSLYVSPSSNSTRPAKKRESIQKSRKKHETCPILTTHLKTSSWTERANNNRNLQWNFRKSPLLSIFRKSGVVRKLACRNDTKERKAHTIRETNNKKQKKKKNYTHFTEIKHVWWSIDGSNSVTNMWDTTHKTIYLHNFDFVIFV